jgi:2-hydroxychromene-2-carboxylate isomerase
MYRYALFRAEQLGIPFKMPPSHPFDSAKALRLAVASGGEIGCIREIFRFIWKEGHDPSTEQGFDDLCRHVGLPDGAKMIELEDVTATLKANVERAVELGVFGVPTFMVNGAIVLGRRHAADGAVRRPFAELAGRRGSAANQQFAADRAGRVKRRAARIDRCGPR